MICNIYLMLNAVRKGLIDHCFTGSGPIHIHTSRSKTGVEWTPLLTPFEQQFINSYMNAFIKMLSADQVLLKRCFWAVPFIDHGFRKYIWWLQGLCMLSTKLWYPQYVSIGDIVFYISWIKPTRQFSRNTITVAGDGWQVWQRRLGVESGPFLTRFPLDKMAANFADDIFKCIFMNETFCISIRISLKFVPKGPIDNKPALVQVMAWRRTGDKPLPEPTLTQFTDA